MKRTTLCLLLLFTLAASARAQPAVDADFFETRIRPLLATHCYGCHGPKKQQAGLRLDSREAILEGSDNGPVVDLKEHAKSSLLHVVSYQGDIKMPPKNKLPAADIQALQAWIKGGMTWPKQTAAAPAANVASDQNPIQLAKKSHWSFKLVQKPITPQAKNRAWPQNAVDEFVLTRLEKDGMHPSAQADRRTLLRRATFDITGLPPTPEEIDAFLADKTPGAWDRVIERLLASPRYGERWGRHWLDIARFADTKGYVFTDERRFPSAYTYRDYVINAFNTDRPYDRFLVEQLAADRLQLGEDKQPLAAMGYLTLGRRFLNNQQDIIDDRIDVVCRGLMGLTVSCARCHDHKFDPIPTRDYYSLYGVFASSREPGTLPVIGAARDSIGLAAYEKEQQKRQAKLQEFHDAQYAELTTRYRKQAAEYLLAALKPAPAGEPRQTANLTAGEMHPLMTRRWRTYLADKARANDPVWACWSLLANVKPDRFSAILQATLADKAKLARWNMQVKNLVTARPPRSREELAQLYGKLLTECDKRWRAEEQWARETGQPTPTALSDGSWEEVRQKLYAADAAPTVPRNEIEKYYNRAARDRQRALKRQIDEWQATAPAAPPRAMVLEDLPTPIKPRVLKRGNPGTPGDEVPRQFLEVLSTAKREPFSQGSGRLELARAIASPDNPLTARVMVNRIWMHHFGAGLVRTPGDFGTRGETPTHPELLDYLADYFVQHGWSVKDMHRLILRSSTYQQQSDENSAYALRDVENRLLWRQNLRRLDFEALRDSFLSASGQLDQNMGGPSVEITTGRSSPRRTLYGFIDRQNLPGLFRTFDLASPDVSTAQRFMTTVPQQALFLLNSPFVLEQAAQLLNRSDVSGIAAPEQRIEAMHRLLYGRSAEREEKDAGIKYLTASGMTQRAWEDYAQVLMLANEFVFID
jgi:hypothetical protein